MKSLLARWVVSAVALYVTALLSEWVNGFLPAWVNLSIRIESWFTPLLAVAVLAVINALIRPLIVILTLPLNCLTMGLLTFVINAFMFWIVGRIVPGFIVNGWLAAIFGSIVMGIISGLANSLLVSREKA